MAPKPRGPKPSAAPSQPPPAIEDLFTTLNKHIERSEFKQAVKVADQVIGIAPGDEDAIRCKVVSLIKSDDIDDALSAIQSAKKFPIDFGFIKAYCLYRQNKLDEALDSLKGLEKNASTMVLESQILYRLGRLDESVDIYQKLQKSKIDSLEINLVASLVAAGRASEVQAALDALRIKSTSTFELAYNTACSLIEREKYSDAENLLLSARRIGQEALLEDNLEADEVEIELAPITVQLAYVQQLFGRTQEAIEAYTGIIKREDVDKSSLAVAVNNLVSLRNPRDFSDGLRKLDRLKDKDAEGFQLAQGVDLKLLRKQREALYTNRVLLLLQANKLDQAREIVATLANRFPDSVMPLLLQAAVLVKENKAGKAEEILGQFAEKFPTDKSKIILLARAQVAAAAGHPLVAAESLVRVPDIQHMPGTVATVVALKERGGDIDGASSVLDSAIKWWSNAMTEDSKVGIIIQEAASFKLRHGRQEEAALLFEELVKSNGSIEAIVGLVSTVARVDINKAESYEKKLKGLPGLKGIDVDALEKTSGAKHEEGAAHIGIGIAEEKKSKEKGKKKRKRKPRYPKGFDPANPGPPPDPERWLPKRERSSYRPKRKDKRAAQVRGSQGAVVRGDKQETNAVSNSKPNEASSSKGQNPVSDHPKPSSKSSRKKSRK